MGDDPTQLRQDVYSQEEVAELRRRRRGRNLALLIVLLGLSLLFFAITIVKLARI